MKAMRNTVPNTTQEGHQHAERQKEYIARKRKAFSPTAHLGLVKNLLCNPLESFLLTFECSF